MSKTKPCALHLLTLQDAGLSARLQVQVTAARCTCRSLRVLTRAIDHSTVPFADPAPAPWPPELGEEPRLTAQMGEGADEGQPEG